MTMHKMLLATAATLALMTAPAVASSSGNLLDRLFDWTNSVSDAYERAGGWDSAGYDDDDYDDDDYDDRDDDDYDDRDDDDDDDDDGDDD